MTTHRFCFSLEGDPFSEERARTIDTAIFMAGQFWAKYRSAIYVREVNGAQTRTRGVADRDGWHWLVACPKCKGTGEIAKRTVLVPLLNVQCTRCMGSKLVRGDRHG